MDNIALDLEAIEGRCEAARCEVNRLCQGKTSWMMSIPVRADDTDVILTDSFRDIPALVAEVARLRRELYDERVRRDEWEKMHNQAIGDTEVEQPRERPGYWMHVDLNVAQTERSKQLAATKAVAKTWFKKAMKCKKELKRVQTDVDGVWAENTRLAASYQGDADAICEALGVKWTEDNKYPTVALSAITQVQVQAKRAEALAQKCNKREIQLAQVREELAQVRADLADSVQGLWLSPVEAEGLRQQLAEMEHYVNDCRVVLTGVRKVLDECQVEGKYDADAVTRIRWLNQRAERAEALAELVTPRLAAMIEKIANATRGWTSIGLFTSRDSEAARALAAKIKELLK